MRNSIVRTDRSARDRTDRIIGFGRSGLTKTVASQLGKHVADAFKKNGQSVRLKGMRFMPSTKVELTPDTFQVMANAVVETYQKPSRRWRTASFDSVVTVGTDEGSGQVLKAVKIPALDQVKAKAAAVT